MLSSAASSSLAPLNSDPFIPKKNHNHETPNAPFDPSNDQNHETPNSPLNPIPQLATDHFQSITRRQFCTSSTISLDGLSIKQREKVNQVREIVQNLKDPAEQMVMIENLQRLGIDYHFREEIESILCSLSENDDAISSIHDVALRFRLLREHGYYASPDVFNSFKDKEGRFKLQLTTDIKGLLSLYESSKLSTEGEDILDEVNDFASKNLIASMEFIEPDLEREVRHALEHPFHMSLTRFNIKKHLKELQGKDGKTDAIQELAILDFNILQSMHQSELKEVTKWWRDLGLSRELRFARDQPLKWYMWPLAVLPNPKFSRYRIELTKPIALVYMIDDIYDVYGTLDELVLFTEAVNRWDPSDINQLPRNMKLCFMALHNITNEIAYMVLKEHGWNPINSLKKTWRDLCNAFLVEAKWFAEGDSPKADEYLRNGVTSSGVATVLVHLFFLVGHGITRESVDLVDSIPKLISCPAMILRLWDDLGSAKDENQKGYDGSYVECYLKENATSSSIESARRHVRHMISNAWKELNKECLSPYPFSPTFIEASLNTTRMVQVMYSYDNDQRLPALEQHITSLLKESIPDI